jgi:hypothetical protein
VALCLWLGDNGVALSMVKRAQYSNRYQTSNFEEHQQSNIWKAFLGKILKIGIHYLIDYLINLFNQVVCSRFAWSHHSVHPIYKSSSTKDPKNYPAIMVGHTLSKLYATVNV